MFCSEVAQWTFNDTKHVKIYCSAHMHYVCVITLRSIEKKFFFVVESVLIYFFFHYYFQRIFEGVGKGGK